MSRLTVSSSRAAADILVKFGLLLGDTLMNSIKGLNDSPKRMADVHQFDDPLREWRLIARENNRPYSLSRNVKTPPWL